MHASLTALSLLDVARLVKARLVSPVELTRAALDRISTYNSKVHAFITVTAEEALSEASRAEDAIGRDEWLGPLHGIPIAYKDNIEIAGHRTTAHSRSMAGHVSRVDAEVVRRLRAAGAVSLGKLSLQELAYGSPGADDAFPSARNPWSLAHSPGGSSSGSGAAVAAGFAWGAIGTDTGGSIRHPAAVCGVVGIKPTFGRVSVEGTIALSHTQDHVGPLTRSVRDNAVMLEAMSGARLPAPRATIASLRIGVPRDLIERVNPDPCVQAAFERTLALLRELGAELVDISTPHLADFNALGTRIILAEAWAQHGKALYATPELFGDAFRTRVLRGEQVSAADYEAALVAQVQIQDHYARLFSQQVEAIVSPSREEPAMTMEKLLADPLGVRGQFTRIYNLARIPALAMPMGFSPEGLPLSVQIAAAANDEATVYDIASALEREAGWTRFQPDLASQQTRGTSTGSNRQVTEKPHA